jgi:hypothetical protein
MFLFVSIIIFLFYCRMEKKKVKNLIQGFIFSIFVIMALACGPDYTASDGLRDFSTGFSQGYSQGSQGRKFLGVTSSESQCLELARKSGCSSTYAWYKDTGNCFCN